MYVNPTIIVQSDDLPSVKSNDIEHGNIPQNEINLCDDESQPQIRSRRSMLEHLSNASDSFKKLYKRTDKKTDKKDNKPEYDIEAGIFLIKKMIDGKSNFVKFNIYFLIGFGLFLIVFIFIFAIKSFYDETSVDLIE